MLYICNIFFITLTTTNSSNFYINFKINYYESNYYETTARKWIGVSI